MSLDHRSLIARYGTAAALTGPRAAARAPGLIGDSYWLDENSVFFVERQLLSGAPTAWPSLSDGAGNVTRLVEPQALATSLAQCGAKLCPGALARARYDVPDRRTLTVRLGARAWRLDLERMSAAPINEAFARSELYSPDGHWACFVKGNDLWLRDRRAGALRPLTSDGAPHCAYGQPSETGLAAISYRRNPYPVGLWTADSRWFITHQIDERDVPDATLIEHASPSADRPQIHSFKYVLPGDPLPCGTFIAIDAATGEITRFADLASPISGYSPFFLDRIWPGAEASAWFVRLDRYAQKAELIHLDLADGSHRIVHSETAESGFLGLNSFLLGKPNVRTLQSRGEFIWYSEADGWGHLYLHDIATGHCKRRITEGAWKVRDLLHVDAVRGEVYFLAGGIDPETDPARRSLCRASLDTPDVEILSHHDGDVFIAPTLPWGAQMHPFAPPDVHMGLSPQGSHALAQFGNAVLGDSVAIIDTKAGHCAPIIATAPEVEDVAARHFSVFADDGATRLHGMLFFPPDFDERQSYPLIDLIYPGPQISQQQQFQQRLKAAPARALAALGFVVMMLDTRGMPVGSRAFHQAGYPQLLEPQVSDHAAVVRQLVASYTFLDAERVGVLGQSGGGAAAVRALCLHGDLYKAGVAACGNHDPDKYCALWSDTYRGPKTNWIDENNRALAPLLQRPLLLISGDMDENVPLSQTLDLADALVAANKDFDLLVIPGAGHDVLRTSGYAQRRTWDFFVRHLLGGTPPGDFDLSFTPEEQSDFEHRFLQEFRQ